MGTKPSKAGNNIYCQARLAAAKYNDKLNSREGAAELLGVAACTLASYELDLTKFIPAEMILRMADLYNAPELRNHYCRNCCPLGAEVHEIEADSIDRITVKAMASLKNIYAIRDNLLDIVEDGVISEDEKPRLSEIVSSLDEIAQISQNLKAWIEKN